MYKGIFDETTPLSKYLQTKGLDLSVAINMVETTKQVLSTKVRKFEDVLNLSQKFAETMNLKLDEFDCESVIPMTIPPTRLRKPKRFHDESSNFI